MKMISAKMHGIMDYIKGVAIIIAPWVFNFKATDAAAVSMILFGTITILYSLVTDYKVGIIKMIGMPAHLTLDFIAGLLLALSPWLFGFSDTVYLPHLLAGSLEMITALLSNKQAYTSRYRSDFRHEIRLDSIRPASYSGKSMLW